MALAEGVTRRQDRAQVVELRRLGHRKRRDPTLECDPKRRVGNPSHRPEQPWKGCRLGPS